MVAASQLSGEERRMWETLSPQEDALPVLESHKTILDECLRDHEANPEQGSTWKGIKFRILKKND